MLGQPSATRPFRAAGSTYSRKEDLRKTFNETVASALGVRLDAYYERLTIEQLLDLKAITSTIHATITLKLTVALAEWLSRRLKLTPEQRSALMDAADASKPFESGFDLTSTDPKVVAEVKGNIPVKGGSVFGAAQLKGLTNDVLQMFGRPANGKTIETVSKKSKILREGLSDAMKFLAVYDSEKVREATKKWMASFRKAHEGLKIEFAGLEPFAADTVYVVFLKLDNLPPIRPVNIVTD